MKIVKDVEDALHLLYRPTVSCVGVTYFIIELLHSLIQRIFLNYNIYVILINYSIIFSIYSYYHLGHILFEFFYSL